jgi:hypothetical protein
VAGSYVPRLLPGAPSGGSRCLDRVQDGVRVFYDPALRPRADAGQIRIVLKTFLFMRWLELEGARAVVCAPADEPAQERK